jgi:hypothetical protein
MRSENYQLIVHGSYARTRLGAFSEDFRGFSISKLRVINTTRWFHENYQLIVRGSYARTRFGALSEDLGV